MDETDGWPDKICIQCVHQVSRCHAFKSRVEKSDQQLRQYIKGITVIVEEPITHQIELQRTDLQSNHHQIHRADIQTHQLTRTDTQGHHHVQQTQQQPQRHEIQITRADIPISHSNDMQPQQMIITNGQLHNAQIINTGQIVTTTQGQQMIQTGSQNVQAGQNVQLCQLVQTGNGTVQMIQQNGQPAQVVQIQRTSDDRCEIIVQPDIQGETQYYTEDGKFSFLYNKIVLQNIFKPFFLDLNTLVTVTTQAIHQEEIEGEEEVQLVDEIEEIEEIEESEEIEEAEIEEEDEQVFTLELTDDSECEDKEYLGNYILFDKNNE